MSGFLLPQTAVHRGLLAGEDLYGRVSAAKGRRELLRRKGGEPRETLGSSGEGLLFQELLQGADLSIHEGAVQWLRQRCFGVWRRRWRNQRQAVWISAADGMAEQ